MSGDSQSLVDRIAAIVDNGAFFSAAGDDDQHRARRSRARDKAREILALLGREPG